MAVKEIKKAAVLGAGVMGATIAAHLANVGIPVLLMDIVPRELTPDEEKKGLTLDSPAVRNRLSNAGKAGLIKKRPAPMNPLYKNSSAELISVGNFEDDMEKLKDVDWIIEVILENMEIKKKLFKNLESYWTPGTIVSSNTSGLSINEMVSDCSENFRRYFIGTHFFNPPRHMKLLEIIPCRETIKEVTDYMHNFCEKSLGKGVVFAKDTPNFVANRIGTYAMMYTIKLMEEMDLTIPEVDAITGPPMGHPKTASFKTLDFVGLDTFVNVAKTCFDKSDDEEEKEIMTPPKFLSSMLEKKLLGDKAKQGFYKKERVEGKTNRYVLDHKTVEYIPLERPKIDTLKKVKQAGLHKGFKLLLETDDTAGQFAWKLTKKFLQYSANLIGEIADDIVNIDRAMRWGFNWKLGPFESWDAIGLKNSVKKMKEEGEAIPAVVEEMLAKGCNSFYREDNEGNLYFYDIRTKDYQKVPTGTEKVDFPVKTVSFMVKGNRIIAENPDPIKLDVLKKQNKVVKSVDDGSLIDLGDGIVCLEMHAPQQAISPSFTDFIFEAVEEAEKNYIGLVVGNEAENYCVGANVALVMMAAQGGEWEMLEQSVKAFQDACMALKYAKIPTVAAPHGMTLGGGMEICVHCDRIHAAAETYIGQVEMGVGLIPGGGGNKELLIRYIEGIPEDIGGVNMLPLVQKAFEHIAMARIAFNAFEAKELRYFRPTDRVTYNLDYLIYDAKQTALAMAIEGYIPPRPKLIKVLGRDGIAAFKAGLYTMLWGKYISEHDMKIAGEVAFVLSGGEILPGSLVSEQYLLDIEREAFLRLCAEEKTHERITAMLTTGKPLRN